MRRTGPSNIHLRNLIANLKKQSSEKKVKIWKRVAEELERATRQRRKVNLTRINRYAKAGETVLIPGKVLGMGELDKKIFISAWQFSDSAFDKIKKSGSMALSIQALVQKNPKGEKVRIIG